MRASRLVFAIVGISAAAFATNAAADWPQWRGPNRDNRVTGFTAPAMWPKTLTQVWKVTVGVGDGGPVLADGKLYAFTRQGDEEVTTCLDANTGKELWKDRYTAVAVSGPPAAHPGPRSTPAVAEGKVCTLGVGGVLSCLDAGTGKVVWRVDSKAWPNFYTSSSPLIAGGACIAQLGGRGTGVLTAYDLATGAERWKWSGEGPSYGSPVLATIDGTAQVVAPTEKSLVGINATDGKLLWTTPFTGGRNNTATPVIDGARVIASGRAFQIEKQGDGFAVKELWKGDAPNQFNTPVLKDGLLYGLTSRRSFFCADAQTGMTLWTDATARGDCGTVLDAGTVLLALTSDSDLVAFQPDKKGYTELARIKVADSPTWAPPIIDGKRIFVKDKDSVTLWTLP